MKRYWPILLPLVALLTTSAFAGPWPNPPRNGRHSVQAIFGGRDVIPMCIVAPRSFEDGSAIPNGTSCTIVVYRSRQEGKPGTYTEEVGRGTGPVEREWIDVAAKVPPEGTNGGVVYLASSAIVNGEQSDLNNQFLTIIWSPGNFEIKEYPAAGSKPGAPPGRKARPGPEVYPDWMAELSAIAGGKVADPASAAYVIETPVLNDLDPGLDSNLRLKVNFKPAGGNAIAGSIDVTAWVAEMRADKIVKKVEVKRNEVTGTLTNGVLQATSALQVAVLAAMGGREATGILTAHTTFHGTRNAAGEIPGGASTKMTVTVTGEAPELSSKDWSFVARSSATGGGGGKRVLLAPDSLGGALAAPGQGFQTPACKIAPGIIGGGFQKDVVGVIELDRGGSHFFSLVGRHPNMMLDAQTGRFNTMPGAPTRTAGDVAQWYAGPGGVLESVAVGDGVRVTAVGDGMGEVWARSMWDCKMPDGSTVTGALTSIWVVPVGAQARDRVNQSRTGGTTAVDTNVPGERVGRVTIVGQAILKNGGKGVGGANVALWLQPEGVYYKPEWITQPDGSFRITADASLPGGGLIPGVYEVMVQWHPAGASAGIDVMDDNNKTWVDDDLWPFKKHLVTINKASAASGEIVMKQPVRLVPLKIMDWSRRE